MNYIKMEFSEEKVIALKFQHSPIIYFNIVFTKRYYYSLKMVINIYHFLKKIK